MEKNRLSWRDPKVSLMDLQYHDIRPDKGLYCSLVRRDLVDRITDDEAIERAKHVPPRPPGRGCAASSSVRPTSRARTTASTGSISS